MTSLRTRLEMVLVSVLVVVLIALAGHGVQSELAGSDGKLRAESFYCPVDAERENPKTMLAMGTIFSEIERRGGGTNLVLVDACREDPTRGRGLSYLSDSTRPRRLWPAHLILRAWG